MMSYTFVSYKQLYFYLSLALLTKDGKTRLKVSQQCCLFTECFQHEIKNGRSFLGIWGLAVTCCLTFGQNPRLKRGQKLSNCVAYLKNVYYILLQWLNFSIIAIRWRTRVTGEITFETRSPPLTEPFCEIAWHSSKWWTSSLDRRERKSDKSSKI